MRKDHRVSWGAGLPRRQLGRTRCHSSDFSARQLAHSENERGRSVCPVVQEAIDAGLMFFRQLVELFFFFFFFYISHNNRSEAMMGKPLKGIVTMSF